jgi:hypothetical protein
MDGVEHRPNYDELGGKLFVQVE